MLAYIDRRLEQALRVKTGLVKFRGTREPGMGYERFPQSTPKGKVFMDCGRADELFEAERICQQFEGLHAHKPRGGEP